MCSPHALRYASARRAELFGAFNRLTAARRFGPTPLGRLLRAVEFGIIRAANKFAPKVLP
jgi:hypothetical protein